MTIEVKVPDIGDFDDVPVIGILVSVGDTIAEEDPLIELESDKATMEVPSPVSGTVTEINDALSDEPGLINSDPAAGGWIFKLELSDEAELEGLMDETAYADHTA